MQKIADLLKSKNLKVTPQRLAIYTVLYNTKEHPTAELIYKTLEPTHPTMSLATVYKTLAAFKDAGLVLEINVGEDRFRYDATVKSHPHLICTKCNTVTDLETDLLQEPISKIRRDLNYEMLAEAIFFYGICPSCQMKNLKQA